MNRTSLSEWNGGAFCAWACVFVRVHVFHPQTILINWNQPNVWIWKSIQLTKKWDINRAWRWATGWECERIELELKWRAAPNCHERLCVCVCISTLKIRHQSQFDKWYDWMIFQFCPFARLFASIDCLSIHAFYNYSRFTAHSRRHHPADGVAASRTLSLSLSLSPTHSTPANSVASIPLKRHVRLTLLLLAWFAIFIYLV